MDNFALIKKLLCDRGIDTVGAIRLSDCNILREHKLKAAGFDNTDPLFVYIFAIPYYPESIGKRNVSLYAAPRDYHAYFKGLAGKLTDELSKKRPSFKFAAFADNSPIDERNAAARAGLGVIGKNGLLITEKYSSYVFLGELITNMPTEMCEPHKIKECIGCKKCLTACPAGKIGECLSSLTQKKGALTDTEAQAIKAYGSVWGCDICQEVCPCTKNAIDEKTIYTPIEFFREDLTPYLDKETLLAMSDEEFSLRAYSWRKKETILRNIDILSE